MANETIKYCEKFGIKKLTVVNLADSIEGSIHVTARITNELQTCGQIIGVTELLAQVLGKLANHIPHIVYRSCIGNHDRAIQNYKESLPIDNFSEIIDWGLQMRLQLSGFSNIDFVFDNLSESFGVFSLENGKKVGFSHGDTISLDQAYQSFCGATKSHIDYIILSHFPLTFTILIINHRFYHFILLIILYQIIYFFIALYDKAIPILYHKSKFCVFHSISKVASTI